MVGLHRGRRIPQWQHWNTQKKLPPKLAQTDPRFFLHKLIGEGINWIPSAERTLKAKTLETLTQDTRNNTPTASSYKEIRDGFEGIEVS